MEKGPRKNLDIIYGLHSVMEAIKSEKELNKIFFNKTLESDQAKELYALAFKLGIPCQKVPVEKINQMTRKNHQGVVAFISPVSFTSIDQVVNRAYEEGRDPILLVLDRISDVRNFGAIARSAYGAGIDGLIIPFKGGAAVNEDAMKTSSGALNHLPLIREPDLKHTIPFLKNLGLTTVAITEKADQLIHESTLTGPTALILGSEETGIAPNLLENADIKAKIPMYSDLGSLNVSVAAGIALYEVQRQRHYNIH